MHPRLDHEWHRPRTTGRDDKTSIDLLEHVRGGIHVESSTELQLYKDFNLESPDWGTPESEPDTDSTVRLGSRPRRRQSSIPQTGRP